MFICRYFDRNKTFLSSLKDLFRTVDNFVSKTISYTGLPAGHKFLSKKWYQNVVMRFGVHQFAESRVRNLGERRPHDVVMLPADVQRHARVQLPASNDDEWI